MTHRLNLINSLRMKLDKFLVKTNKSNTYTNQPNKESVVVNNYNHSPWFWPYTTTHHHYHNDKKKNNDDSTSVVTGLIILISTIFMGIWMLTTDRIYRLWKSDMRGLLSKLKYSLEYDVENDEKLSDIVKNVEIWYNMQYEFYYYKAVTKVTMIVSCMIMGIGFLSHVCLVYMGLFGIVLSAAYMFFRYMDDEYSDTDNELLEIILEDIKRYENGDVSEDLISF